MPQDDAEGTDQNVNWQEEGNKIVAEERGEEAPPPDDKDEKQTDRTPAPKQDDKQQTPAQDDKSKPQDQQQAPKQDDKSQTPAPQDQQKQDDKSTQQVPPQQQKAAETPEQKAAREKAEQEEAKKQHDELVAYYKLPDDLSARLATEPEVVLPELAAKLHQAVQKGVQAWASRFVPEVMTHFRAVEEANQKSHKAFYDRWPSLKQYEDRVLQVGAMYRSMNPQATPEEAIERIGQTVCAALGIPVDPKPGQTAPQSPPQPRQPVQQQSRPFRPAAASSSQAGATPPGDNPWEREAEDLLAEDRTG